MIFFTRLPSPPDGESKVWWTRLKQALGTKSSDFVNASLIQLQAAARLPCSGISEIALNAALAMIEGAAPRDELEGALAVQMACTHAAAMSIVARLGGGQACPDPGDQPEGNGHADAGLWLRAAGRRGGAAIFRDHGPAWRDANRGHVSLEGTSEQNSAVIR
jgi:hypothetical protein